MSILTKAKAEIDSHGQRPDFLLLDSISLKQMKDELEANIPKNVDVSELNHEVQFDGVTIVEVPIRFPMIKCANAVTKGRMWKL